MPLTRVVPDCNSRSRAWHRAWRRGDHFTVDLLRHCSRDPHAGATPVLADWARWQSRPGSVMPASPPRTKALLPVHLGGNPCRMENAVVLGARHNLFVVEDAAHALGAITMAPPVGGDPRSDAVVFSFYATKNLTTGEGGMITTHRRRFGERMRTARDTTAWRRELTGGTTLSKPGSNSTLAICNPRSALEQLKRQDEFLAARMPVRRYLSTRLAGSRTSSYRRSPEHCWHLYRNRAFRHADEFIIR